MSINIQILVIGLIFIIKLINFLVQMIFLRSFSTIVTCLKDEGVKFISRDGQIKDVAETMTKITMRCQIVTSMRKT